MAPAPGTGDQASQDASKGKQDQFRLQGWETRHKRNYISGTATDTSVLLIKRMNYVMQVAYFLYSTVKDFTAVTNHGQTSLFLCVFFTALSSTFCTETGYPQDKLNLTYYDTIFYFVTVLC